MIKKIISRVYHSNCCCTGAIFRSMTLQVYALVYFEFIEYTQRIIMQKLQPINLYYNYWHKRKPIMSIMPSSSTCFQCAISVIHTQTNN